MTRNQAPTTAPDLPRYSIGEEVANAITHGVGALLAIAGLAVLCAFAAVHGELKHLLACIVFGSAMIVCFTTSTLYHAIPLERARRVLRALDHAAIFLLIAGTFTPILLIKVGGWAGWTMLSFIWLVAIAGIVARLLLKGRYHNLFVAGYLAMGGSAFFVIKPLIDSLPTAGLALLLGGGATYAIGVIFYKWRRLPYSHAVWHGFVLAGCALHFFTVLLYVIPDTVSICT